MTTQVRGQTDELDLHQLRVIDVLLREQSLTRAALVLDSTQPALSKMLARLRVYFDDPLFVRVSLRMEPTPKALALGPTVRTILDEMQTLRCAQVPFDPASSSRSFSLFAADAGMVVMLPPLVRLLAGEAPGVRLKAVQLEAEHLHDWLQSGKVDLAIGAYPDLTQGIRRQRLFAAGYASLVRQGHPRLSEQPSAEAFCAEQHVIVSASGTGHGFGLAEAALEAAIPARCITARVPSFSAAAFIAKQTDAVVTLPAPLAAVMARELDLALVQPPLALPSFEVAQYWHERYHREPGNQWLRGALARQFGAQPAAGGH
ncbi:LysR family transcriptional regulator [Pseudorhodoferax sp.]|uniref:LysR family transcriptional regulator n=1 Tax=Pseudorhodoferax sp. TaxID=1993553 RepID=UPI002DD64242|nr:LysR family transcriptional regulator [Pseudorhodoferax sp.]